jgi:hypothetical protein
MSTSFSQQKLIFDIETIGVDFESLDKISQEYIEKYTESEEGLKEAKGRLSFSPLTGEIVAIGILNPDTNKGAVYTRVNGQQSIVNGQKSEVKAKLRPWLQDFNLGANYNATMVRKQIKAVYDAASSTPELINGWMLWNPSNVYTKGALEISQ